MKSKVFNDKRCQRILTYFESIGLLVTNVERREPELPISIVDALWVAENAEPRVYEVLPSAILNFPEDWRRLEMLPKELLEIIENIKINKESKLKYYKGIAVREMIRWADLSNLDKRRKAPDRKKKLCSFRLAQKVIQALKLKARQANLSQADYISMLIEQ